MARVTQGENGLECNVNRSHPEPGPRTTTYNHLSWVSHATPIPGTDGSHHVSMCIYLPGRPWLAKPSPMIWPKVTFVLCYLLLGPEGSCCHSPAGRRPDPGCDTERERERVPVSWRPSLGHHSRRPQSRPSSVGLRSKAVGGRVGGRAGGMNNKKQK